MASSVKHRPEHEADEPGADHAYDGGRAGFTTIFPTMYGWIEQI